MGTLNLPTYFNLQEDIKDLRSSFKAIKGLGCNERRVIEILGRRTQAQRLEIAQAYQTVYGESLHKRLKASFSSKLEKCILLWMMDSSERDAILLYELMKVGGRKADRALIGLLCTRNSAQIYLIKQAYYTMFNQTLENHIDGTDNRFVEFQNKSKWAFWRASDSKVKEAPKRLVSITKLLLALVRGSRPENVPVDRHIALNDAHQLNKVITGKVGDDDTLIRILCTRSVQQLTATLNYYHQHYGHDFEQALGREDAGDFEQALRYTVMCYRQPAKFYAEELYAALGGPGTDDDALIRVVTTRAEVDMQYIKLEFTNESKRTIEEMIASDTTGNYRYFLLTLVGPGDLGLFSPRTSHGSAASFYSPRTSNGSASRSQNGSAVSYYSPRSSGQGSFQM
jgi:annexin A7/11